jgi:hypothetical protein
VHAKVPQRDKGWNRKGGALYPPPPPMKPPPPPMIIFELLVSVMIDNLSPNPP